MRTAVLTAVLSFVVYMMSLSTIQTLDTTTNVLIAYSLVEDRDPYLDEYQAMRDRLNFWSAPLDGHLVPIYPPGAAFLAAPAAAIGTLVRLRPPDVLAILLVGKSAAAAATAISVAFVYLAAAMTTGRRRALVVAGLYSLGTISWPTSGGALWQHGPAQLFLAMGLLWLHPRLRKRWGARSGAAFALATTCRFTDATFVLAGAATMAAAHRPQLRRFVVAALVPLALLMVYGVWAYGEPISHEYFGLNYSSEGFDPAAAFVGLAGNFVAPSRGIFVYSPFVVLGLVELARRARRSDAIGAVVRPQLVAVLLIALAAGLTVRWWGGYSYGPRYLADALPLFAFGLALWLRRHRSRRASWLLGVLAVPSLVVTAAGALVYAEWDWEDSHANEAAAQWDLADPQWWHTLTHAGAVFNASTVMSLVVLAFVGVVYLRLGAHLAKQPKERITG